MDEVKADAPATEEDFLLTWLEVANSLPHYSKFRHVALVERVLGRDCAAESLARAIFAYHNDAEEYREIVAKLGYEQAAEQFDKRPLDDKTRKGNFGEVVACEYLRQLEGFDVPVYRLRWNMNPDSSLKGEDALAFKYGNPDGTERELYIVESKVMGEYSSSEIENAHRQIKSGRRPRPSSIPFVFSMLRQTGQSEKADAILQFQNRFTPNPPVRRHLIMLITGNRPRDPFGVIQNQEDVVRNLTAAHLPLLHLSTFVNDLFNAEVNISVI